MRVHMLAAVALALLALAPSRIVGQQTGAVLTQDGKAEQSGSVVVEDGKLVFITAPKASLSVAGTMFAKVLPLPGKFEGIVARREGAKIGIALSPGVDATKAVVSQKNRLQERASDILVIADGFTGTASSDVSIKIPMGGDPREAFQTGRIGISWEDGFLSMVRDEGRTIRLKGRLTIPVADPSTTRVLYTLEYRFQDGARVAWDKVGKTFVFANMKVARLD